MADLVLNPQTGLYEFQETEEDAVEDPLAGYRSNLQGQGQAPMAPAPVSAGLAAQTIEQQMQANTRGKPLVTGNVLQELGQITGNVGTGLLTDFVDLGHLVVDLYQWGQGQRSWEEVGNDADNPLTNWRRKTFRTESQVGEAINTLARFGSLFAPGAALKVGGSVLMGGLKLGTAVTRTQGLARSAAGLAGRGGDALKALRAASGLDTLLQPLSKIKNFGKTEAFTGRLAGAADIYKARTGSTSKFLEKGSRLSEQYMAVAVEDLIKRAPDADFMTRWVRGVESFSKTIWKLPAQQKVRTLGDLVVRDAFATAMLAGNGEEAFDDPFLSQMVADWNIPGVSAFARTLVPDFQDAPLTTKAKLTLEGSIMGLLMTPLVEGFRIGQAARSFVRAPAAQKEAIQGILSRPQLFNNLVDSAIELPKPGRPFNTSQLRDMVTAARQMNQAEVQIARAAAAAGPRNYEFAGQGGFGKARAGGEMPPPMDPSVDPWQRGGQLSTTRAATGLEAPGGQVPEGAPGVEQVSVQDLGTTPQPGRALPPAAGPEPLARRLAVLNLDDPQQLERLRQQGGGAGMTVGERELPRRQPSDAAPEPRFAFPGDRNWVNRDINFPPAPEPTFSFPRPRQPSDGMDWEPAPEPRFSFPRGSAPPEPIVTPEAIRSAVRRDLEEIGRQGGTAEEIGQALDQVRERVLDLLPQSRSGMVDYVLAFNRRVNRAGVMDAADAMWGDAVVRRGLVDGFANLDEDFVAFNFNRAKALELDEADAIDVVATAVDDAATTQRALAGARPALPEGRPQEAAPQAVDPATAAAEQQAIGGVEQAVDQGELLNAREASRQSVPLTEVEDLSVLTVKQLKERGLAAGLQPSELKVKKADLIERITARESLARSTEQITASGMRMAQRAMEAKPGSMTQAFAAEGATAAFADANRYGEILGAGLKQYDEPTAGALAGAADEVMPTEPMRQGRGTPISDALGRDLDELGQIMGRQTRGIDEYLGRQEARLNQRELELQAEVDAMLDEATAARIIQDQSFVPAKAAIPPKMSDDVDIAIGLGRNQLKLMDEVVGVLDSKRAQRMGEKLRLTAREWSDAVELLRDLVSDPPPDLRAGDIRLMRGIISKAEVALANNADQIDTISKVKAMAREVQNEMEGKLNCDLDLF